MRILSQIISVALTPGIFDDLILEMAKNTQWSPPQCWELTWADLDLLAGRTDRDSGPAAEMSFAEFLASQKARIDATKES